MLRIEKLIYLNPFGKTEDGFFYISDRFADAFQIKTEIDAYVTGEDSVLKNAPHTEEMLTNDKWIYSYSRKEAAFPLDFIRQNKFWTSVRRVDDAYGDRNLVCSCNPIKDYMD